LKKKERQAMAGAAIERVREQGSKRRGLDVERGLVERARVVFSATPDAERRVCRGEERPMVVGFLRSAAARNSGDGMGLAREGF